MLLRLAKQGTKAALRAGDQRRRALFSIYTTLGDAWGFQPYARNATWFKDAEYAAIWKGFGDPENVIQDRRFNLYGLAKLFAHIPGDLAECGVNRGRGSHVMLVANPNGKHLYGFNSFEGLSDLTGQDLGDVHWQPGDFAYDEAAAARNLAQHEGRFTLLRGWIPERFPEVAEKQFSFVHVDVDLYEPTRDSYEFFWPRLSPGGAIVCDDYGSLACPGARKAVDEFAASVGVPVAELSSYQSLMIKP